MPKGPNSRPDKGFVKEIAKAQGGSKIEINKKGFDYKRPVTPESRAVNGMHTPHRMREFKHTNTPNDFAGEASKFIGEQKRKKHGD